MTTASHDERTLEMLLAGTPRRVVDALQGTSVEALQEVDAVREALGLVGLSLSPVPPRPEARARLSAALDAAARPARRPAVVVMDMLIDHLTPGSALEVPRAREIVPAMQRRLDEARRAGTPVIYLVDHHDPGDPELDVWGVHNVGELRDEVWGALAPAPGDAVVAHRAYSGFLDTGLEALLRGMDVNTVELTGCLTEIHLFATAVDALQRGFVVEVPEALQAGSSALAETVVLKTLSVMVPVAPLR